MPTQADASILRDTKQSLGLGNDYTVFDTDVLIHINASLAVLNDLGVGPDGGAYVEDETTKWDILALPDNQLAMAKTWLYLKVRLFFDPPGTQFLLDSMSKQVEEFQWRMNVNAENARMEEST